MAFPRRAAVTAAAGCLSIVVASLAAATPARAQQGTRAWLEARAAVVVPVGEEFGTFADPGLGFGAGLVLAASRARVGAAIDVSRHGPKSGLGDHWNVQIFQAHLGWTLGPEAGLELAPFIGAGVVRFDPDPGTGVLRTLTPFALSAGLRAALPLSQRLALVARGSLVLAGLGGERPGPDGSFLAPLGLGLALRL